MIILQIIYVLVGGVAIGLCRIKVPSDTPDGERDPDVAWLAWLMMIFFWPLTVWHRDKFARYGDPRDEQNPTWLAETRNRGN